MEYEADSIHECVSPSSCIFRGVRSLLVMGNLTSWFSIFTSLFSAILWARIGSVLILHLLSGRTHDVIYLEVIKDSPALTLRELWLSRRGTMSENACRNRLMNSVSGFWDFLLRRKNIMLEMKPLYYWQLKRKNSPVVEHYLFYQCFAWAGGRKETKYGYGPLPVRLDVLCLVFGVKRGVWRLGSVRISCGVFDSLRLCETLHQVKGPTEESSFEGMMEARTRSERWR